MVLVQVVSDLHLETHPSYSTFDLPATAPYLALLGDIGHVCEQPFLEWLKSLLSRYKIVFYLFGNHEAYHMRLSSAKARIKDFATRMEALRMKEKYLGQFVFLDQTRYDLPPGASSSSSPSSSSASGSGATILGCTLYSQVTREQAQEVADRFVDFRDLIGWDVGDHNDCHEADVEWLNGQVEEIAREDPERRIIVLTHYCPTVDQKVINPNYPKSTVDSGFMTDLSGQRCWKSPLVKVWAFGHTHYNVDFTDQESGKRVIANQKGYYKTLPSRRKSGDRLSFQIGKTVEI